MLPPNSSLWQLHCCWCRVVLLWLLNSNKRNLVEVQLEKSKLAVGHFDKLQRRAMATPALSGRPTTFTCLCQTPPRKQSTSKELNKAACRAVKQHQREFFQLSFVSGHCNRFRTIIPHVGRVGWGGGPPWCWNGSTPGFSFDSCSCVVISQPARTCIRELRWYYRDKVSRGQRKSPPDEEDVCVNHHLFATSSSSRWKTFHLAHSNFFFLVYLQYTHSSTFL